ncbi:MAG: methionyl-tRNA formyltransferase [Terriglobia bacterium]
MKLIFFGTPQFAVPVLERLLAEGFSIPLVVANPDEPRGRGYALTPPPVKEAALRAGLKVFQPPRLKDIAARADISAVQPDVAIVVAYGHIIPPWMIHLPPLGCINLHASLLPCYRGAAPIHWAIIRGERVTGVTTMKIDEGLDTGDILLQKEIAIEDVDTTETLSERLSHEGAELMVETLKTIREIHPRPQDHRLATLAPILKKEYGQIHWSLTASEIVCRVRGLRPWPVAHTTFRGRNLLIWMARPDETKIVLAPGELKADAGGLIAGCGAGTQVEITELQIEGRKRISAREFVNGMRLQAGERMG